MTIVKYLVFIRACGSVEPRLFVVSYSTMFPTTDPLLTIPSKGTYLFRTRGVLESSVGRRSSELEEVLKVLTEFSEAIAMAGGIRSGAYRDH